MRTDPKDISTLSQVAGNGLLSRRLFLKQGLLFAAAATIPESEKTALANTSETTQPKNSLDPPWRHTPGDGFSSYGEPSPYEKNTVRFPSSNSMSPGNGVSWCPLHKLEGMITPNGLHFERHHNGVPNIDPNYHQLLVYGLVKQPLLFSIDDLLRYPMRSKICFIECGGNSNTSWNRSPINSEAGYSHGLVSCSEWTGIPIATILQEANIYPKAKWIIAEGSDAFSMNVSIPIEQVVEEGLIALYQNGERLRPENGYPLRLVLPGLEGVLNVKWLHKMKIAEKPVMARNETAKYTELLPSGKARLFTFKINSKSLITSPSANMYLQNPGLYQITGLAWSGRGHIKMVEVSADGGKSWAEAELQAPILPKAFTRFRIPWQWDGQPAILQSRATDSTGCRQPSRAALIANYGKHGFFHFNGIVSWGVNEDGEVRHVYVDKNTTTQPAGLDADWD